VITRARASVIAHGDLRYYNPVSAQTIETVIDMLPLDRDDRVLDVGCGRGELLLRIAERTGASGTGIDLAEEQIAAARSRAAARVPDADLRFEQLDASELVAPDGSFAVAACVGSTHALGGLTGTLERLAALVRPGGYVLIGEGFWALPPSAAFLSALDGAREDELTSYPELLAAGDRFGLQSVYATTASAQDWERYEWTNILHADRYAQQHPDEDGIELLHTRVEAARSRRALAAADGETLGFALLVWRR
jgi:ubiquinone/menaquinone biosynthesis C-methylase UbiE